MNEESPAFRRGSVKLLLPEQRGAVRMTPEAAVYLAQQLLDAAHKVQPGCAGIMIGGHRA